MKARAVKPIALKNRKEPNHERGKFRKVTEEQRTHSTVVMT